MSAPTRLTTARRIPRGLPFVMRHSPVKVALLLLIAAAACELGVWIQTEPAERADTFGSVWVHVLVGGIFVLTWLYVVALGPALALDGAGVWVALRGWPRGLAVRVPWERVDRVVEKRHGWHSVVGVVLDDPGLLGREALGRRAGSFVATSRDNYRVDLAASLTLSNATSARVAEALARFAPAGVAWRMSAPDVAARANTPGRWTGRIAVTVGWLVLFLFVLPVVVLRAAGAGLDSVPGGLTAFALVSVGTATLPTVLNAYERLVQRGR